MTYNRTAGRPPVDNRQARFARAIARAEFGRFYVSEQDLAVLQFERQRGLRPRRRMTKLTKEVV
jgi:hypothetical protein